MSRGGRDDKNLADIDELLGKTTVDAHGDDATLWALRQAFEDGVTLPSDGFVIGEPVSVTQIDYDGNERRGLTARCRREDGSEHVVAAIDVVFPQAWPEGTGKILLDILRTDRPSSPTSFWPLSLQVTSRSSTTSWWTRCSPAYAVATRRAARFPQFA